jgi:hypothetical protein
MYEFEIVTFPEASVPRTMCCLAMLEVWQSVSCVLSGRGQTDLQ